METKVKGLKSVLEENGAFLLGEPFVQIKPQAITGFIDFSIFLSYKTHGVHFVLFNSTMLPTEELKIDDLTIMLFSDFLHSYGNEFYIEEDYFKLQALPKVTEPDNLKLYGGLKILEQEHGIIFRGALHGVVFLFHDLMQKVNSTHVEHCIYLAKTQNETLEDLKDFIHVPMELLPEIIPLNPMKYKTISFPYFTHEKLQAKRKVLPILKP